MDIQVVLTENDPKLGKRGQVIKVSSGYAQNFLFPHNKAKLATPGNVKAFEAEKARQDKEAALHLEEARRLAAGIRSTPLVLEAASSGDGEKLFGAVTAQDIVEALAKNGIVCDRKKAHLAEPIKKLGRYEVEFRLHPDVTAKLQLEVVKRP